MESEEEISVGVDLEKGDAAATNQEDEEDGLEPTEAEQVLNNHVLISNLHPSKIPTTQRFGRVTVFL